MNKIIAFIALFSAVYVFVFLLPNHVDRFALTPEKVQNGEFWRFVTYPFTHLATTHLVENIIGLVLVGILAIELKTLFGDFSSVYMLAGFFAVIPIWLIMLCIHLIVKAIILLISSCTYL